ncbi:MAG: AAA family ATPase [Candidatus Margulisiibacteriota bacterium]
MNIRAIFLLVICCLCLNFSTETLAANNASAIHYYNQATTQYLVGDLKKALNSVQKSLKLNPDDKGAKELKKSIMRELGIKYIVKKTPDPEATKKASIEAYLSEGKNLYDLESYAKAEEIFGKVLVLDPNQKEALLFLESVRGKLDEKAKWRFYALFFITVIVAGSILTLLYFLVDQVRKLYKKNLINSNDNYCFNCKSKLPPRVSVCPNCGVQVGLKIWSAISNEQNRWYKKLNWKSNPFTLDIHPELFTGKEKQVKEILEKIKAQSGHILIVGPLGIGKTTLLRWLSNQLPRSDYYAIYISRPPVDFSELTRHIFNTLGWDYAKESNFYNLDMIRQKLNKRLIIFLDEAHEFTVEIERPLRTLGDIDGVKLVLAGLPETVEKLRTEIQPFYERLVLKITFDHLEYHELIDLIKARIESVHGVGTHPFTESALKKVYEISGGNPRRALKLCDNAVTTAINKGEDNIVDLTIKETDFSNVE